MKKLIYICILILAFSALSTAQNQPSKASSFAEVRTGDEKFDRIFREGRDLIDKEEWKQAADKFSQIVCDCPANKQVDAAFYWLAFSYKKLKMYEKAGEAIDRLQKNFPNSTWLDDAQVMGYEIQATRPANLFVPRVPQIIGGQNLAGMTTSVTSPLLVTPIQLDRVDEIKLAAFQSLLVTDSIRGIEALGNVLKTEKASETLKREVIRTLRSPRPIRTVNLSNYGAYETTLTVIGKQNIPLLRDTLLRSYQADSNLKIRTEIIYALINLNDEQSVNYLTQLYNSESDKEIKKALINSYGSAENSYYLLSGQFYFPSATREIVGVAKAPTAKTQAETTGLTAIGASNKSSPNNNFKKVYFDKLMEIVRTENDEELRRLAFSNLQKFSGWSTRDGIFEMFSQMYDAESDEQFKASIIRAFANLKQEQAIKKLLDIAKNDKSDKMRLEAIYSLRGSKSPEVIKFLEDLIN